MLQTLRRVSLPSTSGGRLMSSMMILPISLAHYSASSPLCVVKLCFPEFSIPSSRQCAQATGTGANLIKDPLPLLNRSPSWVYSCCSRMNSYIDMEMFPPRPMEQCLPPLLSPCSSHRTKRQRMWVGLKRQSFSRMLSAMHRPIEASSVHTETLPDLLCFFRSSKPVLTMPRPLFWKWWNSVHEPRASPMPMPITAPIPLDCLKSNSNLIGLKSLLSSISMKICLNLMRSQSFLGMMLWTLQHWFMLWRSLGLAKQHSMSHIILFRQVSLELSGWALLRMRCLRASSGDSCLSPSIGGSSRWEWEFSVDSVVGLGFGCSQLSSCMVVDVVLNQIIKQFLQTAIYRTILKQTGSACDKMWASKNRSGYVALTNSPSAVWY